MKDTWSIGPLSKFNFEEKKAIKQAMKEEYNRYVDIAQKRFPSEQADSDSLMMSLEEQQVRAEVMRRNVVQQLKHKHMHDFRRKMVDQILKEREKLPGYKHDIKKKERMSLLNAQIQKSKELYDA